MSTDSSTTVSPEELDKLATQLLDVLPEESRGKAQEVMQAFGEGASLGGMNGIDDRQLEMIYSVAHNFYANKKYDDAFTMFRFLVIMSHTNQKYWIGFGCTQQLMEDYEGAVEAFGYATILDMDNPTPQIQAGYCLMQLERWEEAKLALEGALMAENIDENGEMQAEALLAKIDAQSAES